MRLWLALLAVLAGSTAAAAPCRLALAMALDVSGSVDQKEYRLQLDGLAKALTDPDVSAAFLGMPGAPVAHAVYEWSASSYQRVVSYVGKSDCVPLKSEMWETSDRLRKVMSVDRDTLFVEEQIRMPRKIRMDDELNKTHTELEIQTIEVGTKIPRKMFEITTLERGQLN